MNILPFQFSSFLTSSWKPQFKEVVIRASCKPISTFRNTRKVFYSTISQSQAATTSVKMAGPFNYPEVRRDEGLAHECHGTKVPDPYGWLEDPDSLETAAFVEAQNKLTVPYLESCSVRSAINQRITKLWDYPKHSVPQKRGDRYYSFKNTGLQNQSVIYVQNTLTDEPTVFLDPNLLSDDGTTAISTYKFSEDGKIFAYGLSKSGSDWMTIHFKSAETGEDYPEILEKVKFTGISWTHDNLGIFYGRYPEQEGRTDGSETTSNEHQKLYYHRLGTSQSEDVLVVEFPDNPQWRIMGSVSQCGNYLLVQPEVDCRDNLVYFTSLVEPIKNGIKGKLPVTPVVDKFESHYSYITNDGPQFVFLTNHKAPNYHLVKIDLENPQEDKWEILIPEHPQNVLDWAAPIHNDKLVLCYIEDVKSTMELHSLADGSLLQKLPLEVGTVVAFSGKRKHSEFFFQFSSFLTPSRIYQVDFTKGEGSEPVVSILRETTLEGYDANEFKTEQVFYTSKDGTKIPMFIVSRKDLIKDGSSPCLLYSYGGFNHSLQPYFSVTRIAFMQFLRGIIAIPNIRGGGEYGEKWHNGGRLFNKQNCFDDFISAAEYLNNEKYTSTPKLAIQGASNGGLLIGACVNQRPDLFGAGLAQVGVMDMLRFHKFTIGYAWTSDYGNPDEKEHFDNLIKFSPLHNIRVPVKEDVQYPAVLCLTADHDDRVVPCHSFKYISELQKIVGNHPRQTNPLMIRIETKAGHGGGKPTAKVIEEHTDILCFLIQALNLKTYDLE